MDLLGLFFKIDPLLRPNYVAIDTSAGDHVVDVAAGVLRFEVEADVHVLRR